MTATSLTGFKMLTPSAGCLQPMCFVSKPTGFSLYTYTKTSINTDGHRHINLQTKQYNEIAVLASLPSNIGVGVLNFVVDCLGYKAEPEAQICSTPSGPPQGLGKTFLDLTRASDSEPPIILCSIFLIPYEGTRDAKMAEMHLNAC